MPAMPPTTDLQSAPRALVADPRTTTIVRRAVAVASRRCPRLADEFESHAWAALWSIALDYRADSPMPWPQFLRIRMACAMSDLWRHWAHGREGRPSRAPMLSLDMPAEADDDEPTGGTCPATLADLVVSGDLPVGWEIEDEDSVRSMIARLGGLRRRAMLALFLECSGDRAELAERLGTTPGALSTHLYVGVREIRESIEMERRAG